VAVAVVKSHKRIGLGDLPLQLSGYVKEALEKEMDASGWKGKYTILDGKEDAKLSKGEGYYMTELIGPPNGLPWNGLADPDETLGEQIKRLELKDPPPMNVPEELTWAQEKVKWEKMNPGQTGMKYSEGKPRWQLMGPLWPAMEQVVTVLTRGAEKYADDNWMDVDRSEYIRAIMSHYSKYASGEVYDKDMGSNHLANLICSALFLLWKDGNNADDGTHEGHE